MKKSKLKKVSEKADNLNKHKAVYPVLYLFLLLAISFAVLSPVLKNTFLSYDDTENVTSNYWITSLNAEHLKAFFTTPLLFMYTPLVFLSFAIDYSIGGLDPFVFHLSSLFLHLLNTVLVYVFIHKLTGNFFQSLVAAALFAVHPLSAETVAWVSTRSTLLFTLFFLASLIAYLKWIEQGFKVKHYLPALLLFLLSILSKPSAVVLPLVLFIIDYFKNRSLSKKLIAEKIPFLIFSIAGGLIMLWFRSDSTQIQTPVDYNLTDRIFIIIYSISVFIIRFIFPFQISSLYTYPEKINNHLPFEFYLSLIVILVLIFVAVKFKNQRKILVSGLLFFAVILSVNLFGFLEDGFTANRYAYLSYVGLGFIAASFAGNLKPSRIISLLCIAFILSVSFVSHSRTKKWKNDFTLFDEIIEQQPRNAFAYNVRGVAKYSAGDLKGSVEDYSKALEINPEYPGAHGNRAISFYQLREFENAFNDYNKAIEQNPLSAKSYMGRGIIKAAVLNDLPGAIKDFDAAIRINPAFFEAYMNRGMAKLKLNDKTGACLDFNQVKKLGYRDADNFLEIHCR